MGNRTAREVERVLDIHENERVGGRAITFTKLGSRELLYDTPHRWCKKHTLRLAQSHLMPDAFWRGFAGRRQIN